MSDIFGNVIFKYTRQEAIEDGELIDVSKTAQEAGFKYPVVVTRAVWYDYIVPDDRARAGWGQSEDGRLWDTLWMAGLAARKGRKTDQITFQVYYIMKEKQKKLITLKMICGPGDNAEPVITIMRPDED